MKSGFSYIYHVFLEQMDNSEDMLIQNFLKKIEVNYILFKNILQNP